MQATLAPTRPSAAQRPFTTAGAKPARSSVVVRAAAGEAPALTRRAAAAAALAAAAPLLLSALPARALIPDDDDEDMVGKARANRAKRLADEKASEKAFARSEGYGLEAQLIPVQKAINALAASGAALESGNVSAVAAALRSGWQTDFKAATSALSIDNSAAQGSAGAVLSSLSALDAAAGKGSLQGTKQNFVSTVVALQTWAGDAGIASSLKGL